MTVLEARVPYVAQNDAHTGAGFLCGAAAVQAILYGRDNFFFDASSPAVIKPAIPVRADQDEIWKAIKAESVVVAPVIGGQAAVSEVEQLCDPSADPRCWATHPTVMGNLIERGIPTSTRRLRGIAAAKVQLVKEHDVVERVRDSLSRGVGAALLVGGQHWVIVYRCVDRSDHDLDIFFHDPRIDAETVWRGVRQLKNAVVDSGPTAGLPGTQTVVIGAQAAASPHRVRRRRPVIDASPADPPGGPPEQLYPHLVSEFKSMLAGRVRQEERLGPWFDASEPIQVLPVRNRRKLRDSYYLVQFGKRAVAVVDATTYKPLLTASASGPEQQLPPILDRATLERKIDGKRVKIHGVWITLDRRHFRFEDDLVWERCDQSQSMLVPFYVVRQPQPGGAADATVYVRVSDGETFGELTRKLGGV